MRAADKRAADKAAHRARALKYQAREAAGKTGDDKDLRATGKSGQAKVAIAKRVKPFGSWPQSREKAGPRG